MDAALSRVRRTGRQRSRGRIGWRTICPCGRWGSASTAGSRRSVTLLTSSALSACTVKSSVLPTNLKQVGCAYLKRRELSDDKMDDTDALKVLIESTQQARRFNEGVLRQAKEEAKLANDKLEAAQDNDLRLTNALHGMGIALRNLSSERNVGTR